MADDERCGTCRFWVSVTPEIPVGEDAVGGCHRLPPVVIERVRHKDDSVSDITADWPETLDYEWCGEWKAKG